MYTHDRYCTISFPTEEDMDKAFDVLIYQSDKGFSSAGENALTIDAEQCQQLEKLQAQGELSYSHLD